MRRVSTVTLSRLSKFGDGCKYTKVEIWRIARLNGFTPSITTTIEKLARRYYLDSGVSLRFNGMRINIDFLRPEITGQEAKWRFTIKKIDTGESVPYGFSNTIPVNNPIGANIPVNRPINAEIVIPDNLKHLFNSVNENYTFGVEMEFCSRIDGAEVCRAFTEAGLTILDRHHSYGQSSTTQWVLCYDSSVGTDGMNGYELTTPILKGKTGLKKLYTYLRVMKKLETENKIKIKKTCGLHIHIGSFGTDKEIARKFRRLYGMNEKIIDKIFPNSRRESNNQYCNSITRNGVNEDYKYQKVSLRNFNSNGTFEVRQHSGSIDFEKIANWLVFNQTMLNKVSIDMVAINSSNSMFEFFRMFTTENGCMYFLKRLLQMNPAEQLNLNEENN